MRCREIPAFYEILFGFGEWDEAAEMQGPQADEGCACGEILNDRSIFFISGDEKANAFDEESGDGFVALSDHFFHT